MGLNGKTAVVTGGGRGIGRAYCERLAADGANVVVVDIEDPAPVVAALAGSREKVAMICDVSKPEQIRTVANRVLERFGRCDIFVNNAAILPVTDLKTVSLDVWQRVQAVNVEPLMLFAQAFVPGMAAAGWGRIVSTGSSVTLHPQTRDLAYITSKGSIHALTRALANEVAEMGFAVNAIAPTILSVDAFRANALIEELLLRVSGMSSTIPKLLASLPYCPAATLPASRDSFRMIRASEVSPISA